MMGPYLQLRKGVGTYHQRSNRGYCWLNLEPICSQRRSRGWSEGFSLGRDLGPVWAAPWVVCAPLCQHATEEVKPRDRIWFGTECLLP